MKLLFLFIAFIFESMIKISAQLNIKEMGKNDVDRSIVESHTRTIIEMMLIERF